MRKKVKLDKTLLAMLLGARITTDTPQTHKLNEQGISI